MDGRGCPSVPGVREADQDPPYAAYVLILVLGLRKGEVIRLSWSAVNLDRAELRCRLAAAARRPPWRPHQLAAFVFEDNPAAEGRRGPFIRGQVSFFQTSTAPSSRSMAPRAPAVARVVAVGITPANAPEASVTGDIAADLDPAGLTLAELHIDRAYLPSALVRDRSPDLAIYCKAGGCATPEAATPRPTSPSISPPAS